MNKAVNSVKMLRKCTGILVESGYALKAQKVGLVQLTEGAFAREECVAPFADTLEGRRQADAIEDWLFDSKFDTWAEATLYTVRDKALHQWRLGRIKWCIEELIK